MTNVFRWGRWSPYVVGAGIGVLSWATFGLMGKALGVSTTPVRIVGMLEGAVAPDHVRENAYFAKYLVGKPGIEWQFALVMMLAVGAWVAARLARSRRSEHIPPTWAARFGPSRPLRYAGAFAGGVIMIVGARMAGGCTSGHAISGGMQFAVSSWVFLAAMFVTGVATAHLLYVKRSATAQPGEVNHV